MPGDFDARVIANAQRQAELQARHRDLTKPVPPIGTDADSLRQVKGFEGITDAMLDERANFNLRDHMKGIASQKIVMHVSPSAGVIDLHKMSVDDLHGLAGAALSELEQRNKENG